MMRDMAKHREIVPAVARRWPLLLIAAPASVAVWSGWVGLGLLCGFGVIHPLPGIWDGLRVNTDITLPVGVESYGAFALYAWLAPGSGPRTRKFACRSAIGAFALGCTGQVAYHLLAAAHAVRAPSLVVVVVACLPVVTLFLAAALLHLMHAEATEQAAVEAAEAKAIAEAREHAIREAAAVAAARATAEAAASASQMPLQEPRPARGTASRNPDAEAARAEYRKAKRKGENVTDRALAARYGRSRTWGAARIREVDGGLKLAEASR
jgi:hypothetical protein